MIRNGIIHNHTWNNNTSEEIIQLMVLKVLQWFKIIFYSFSVFKIKTNDYVVNEHL